jgi:hypothetical protein
MSAGRCPRLFEVEAARDERLTGQSRDALDLHVGGCPQCRAEARTFQLLAASLDALPVPATDVLKVRRERQRLLAAFNEELLSPPTRGRRAWMAAGIVAAGVAATTSAVLRHRAGAAPAPSVADDPVSIVATAPRAAWWRTELGATTRVRLDEGGLDIHVEHRDRAHRLIVSVPDGELEDVGTTFHVEVHGGHTTAVTVLEGMVVLRRAERSAVTIAAGQSWVPEVSAEPGHLATADPPSHGSAPSPPLPSASEQPRGAGTSAVSREFRDAVDLLEAGNDAAASNALHAFVAHHPGDSRAQDAAYLLVLALRRSGDEAGAREAARDYLLRYAAGFRRPEIESIAR